VILRQFLHTEPVVAASYILGCGGKSACVIVDPVDSPEQYMQAASGLGMAIRCVVDTHVHADHLSTGRALAAAAGAPNLLHESVNADFDFSPVADGDHVEIGNVELEVLHLPGHTPEHIGLVVTDRTRGREPWLVATGHSLVVGDIGFERRFNKAFAIDDETAFVAAMVRDIPVPPPNAAATQAANLGNVAASV